MKISEVEPMDLDEASIITVTGMKDGRALPQVGALHFINQMKEAAEELKCQGHLVIKRERKSILLTKTGIILSRMVIPPGLAFREVD